MRHCNVVGCTACERERLMREEDVKLAYVTTIDVYDAEYDIETYEDVQFGEAANGILIITDLDDLVVAMYAHGSWRRVEVSRAPRLESTGDETTDDGETDGDSAAQSQPDLPRDGS